MLDLALRRVRVADWYIARAAGGVFEVENETYSVLYFDEAGNAQTLPDAGLIRESKSLHVASSADPYAKNASGAGEPRPADSCWSPIAGERGALRGS